jgi:hypothetical protein
MYDKATKSKNLSIQFREAVEIKRFSEDKSGAGELSPLVHIPSQD